MTYRFTMRITSPAFQDGTAIPAKYTCDGNDVIPPLRFEEIPEGTVSLALIVDDPDAPRGTWDHWVLWNIPVGTTQVSEGTEPGGVPGKNSWGRTGWGGPCPPDREHRYFFRLYALDSVLALAEGSTKVDLMKAMQSHILAETKLMGRYDRIR